MRCSMLLRDRVDLIDSIIGYWPSFCNALPSRVEEKKK